MARHHPIRRLIDGRPDDPGRRIARRTTLLMVPAIVGANFTGAVVVFALLAWVLPLPEVDDQGTVILVNLVAASAYVVVACVVGTVWGWRAGAPRAAGSCATASPTPDERRTALRVPLRHLYVSMALWLVAVVGVFALNVAFSFLLAVIVAVVTLLGAVTTGAMAYLLAERIMRAASARALASGVPEKPVLPGVTTRALLAWALGSGVPLVGLCAVAIVALAGSEISEQELALSALALGGVALVVGALITWQAARAVADPVRSVRDALRRVEGGDLDASVPVFDGSDLGLLQAGFNRMNEGLREREELRDLFGRHVGEDVARAAQERGIELGGEELEVAVLFVDLVGSTSMAAERPPQEVVATLNELLRGRRRGRRGPRRLDQQVRGRRRAGGLRRAAAARRRGGLRARRGPHARGAHRGGPRRPRGGHRRLGGARGGRQRRRRVALRVHGHRRPGQRGGPALRAGQGGRRPRARLRHGARARPRRGDPALARGRGGHAARAQRRDAPGGPGLASVP